MTREQAETELIEWARITRDRDRRVLNAYAAGISKNHIHTLTGISRSTIDRILDKEPTMDTVAVLRAKARAEGAMTAAEFDYSLAVGDGRAMSAMHNAAYALANEGHPAVQPGDSEHVLRARRERADALWDEMWPTVEAMATRAKGMQFTGWSDEARARGQKIRYAD